jgi:hypothetical protein
MAGDHGRDRPYERQSECHRVHRRYAARDTSSQTDDDDDHRDHEQ